MKAWQLLLELPNAEAFTLWLHLNKEEGGLPVLRKDFTIDEYQLHEARIIGADAILLIVALMDSSQLDDYLGLAGELGLSALVEVHDGDQLAESRLSLSGPWWLPARLLLSERAFSTQCFRPLALLRLLPLLCVRTRRRWQPTNLT